MTLQRLVLDFRSGELVVRCLYRSKGDSNPGTKERRTYAHARKEKVVAPSSPPNPKSAHRRLDIPTTARGARTLEGPKIAIPIRI